MLKPLVGRSATVDEYVNHCLLELPKCKAASCSCNFTEALRHFHNKQDLILGMFFMQMNIKSLLVL